MGHSTGRHIALLGSMFLLTGDLQARSSTEDIVGGNITWVKPPPLKTVKDASRVSRTTKQVTIGSLKEELSCNFILTPDLTLKSVWMKIRNVSTVAFVPNVSFSVPKGIAKSINATWVPNKLTLFFFNVTDAEIGEYTCNVVTFGSRLRTWTRKIQLLVADSIQEKVSAVTASKDTKQIMVSSITVSLNPSQAMVSSITVSHDLIPTTDYSTRAPEADVPWGIIAAVVGVAVLAAIIIAIVRFLIGRNRFQIRDAGQQGNVGMEMQDQGAMRNRNG